MRIGDIVKIRKCNQMYVNLAGQSAEIVDLPIGGDKKHTIYPVWVRILSDKQQGKTYGFQYDEVEILNKEGGMMKTKVAKQLEEILGGLTTAEEKRGEKALKVGGTVKIKKCGPMPEVLGQNAEIVDLQVQEYGKYTVYPVWVKITTGERQGKIYGFRYDEVEVLPRTCLEEMTKMEALEHMGKMLGTMRAGGTIKIRKCDSLPGVVGESAEIVDMQVQEYDEYGVYPLWAKITSGEKKGKVYGFKYDEVELLPKALPAAPAKTRLAEQLEEILKSTTTLGDIAEIERAIDEVKGNIMSEAATGFWEDKTPCWEMLRCPEAIRNECPAFKHQGMPCWQMEGTYCKLHCDGEKGHNTDICRVCRVYKRWGNEEPIEIKLAGKGFNQAK